MSKKDGKVKTVRTLSWKFLILGIGFLVVGIGIGVLWWSNQTNVILAFMTVLTIPFGSYLLYMAFKESSIGYITADGKRKITRANCLNIYARKENGKILPDKIAFEDMGDHPTGRLMRDRKDGKHYFVNQFNIKTNTLVPLQLPDNQYCDPARLLQAARMERSREYYTPVPNFFQKVRPALMLAGIAILGVILIALSPAPGG